MLTCEHASNAIPDEYAPLFRKAGDMLGGHCGWDMGAAALARHLADRFQAPLFEGETSRLLIDLNRSLGHPTLFSAHTRPLDSGRRQRLVNDYWRPWRDRVDSCLSGALASNRRVVHVSVHSFTPLLGGQARRADIGLLYDPGRGGELDFARRWQAALRQYGLNVRRNYPYQGRADGFTTALRRRFPAGYLGLELETNQAWVAADSAERARRFRCIANALAELEDWGTGLLDD